MQLPFDYLNKSTQQGDHHFHINNEEEIEFALFAESQDEGVD